MSDIEQKLAEKLGFRIKDQQLFIGGKWYKPATIEEVKLWDALCAAEKRMVMLTDERDQAREKLLCQCMHPYFGTQLIGTPPRCERCGKDVGEHWQAIRERAEAAERENAALKALVERQRGIVREHGQHDHDECHYPGVACKCWVGKLLALTPEQARQAADTAILAARHYCEVCDAIRGDDSDGATSMRRNAYLEMARALTEVTPEPAEKETVRALADGKTPVGKRLVTSFLLT